ncbi:hypothetical protein [Rhizobium leguminosarum]|uniref:hypothetical protein n=1 Tax=Rhizobium leguminosarum TaxID=384 RepID=UPI001C97BF4E|nr:hypothetical protein [Rhizobium leguminosarum]MBY5561732.1 hypothetical protein [Rhizobium leguminosarum]
MSLGGGGVPGIEEPYIAVHSAGNDLPWVPWIFKPGGRVEVTNSPSTTRSFGHSCVLCGGVIFDDNWNYEHPLPQWVHRMAGDAGERRSGIIRSDGALSPTWRQLCLASHRSCNSLFAKYIENPARSGLSAMVDGGVVTSTQIDAILDWLDKVRSASAHMATAFTGHPNVLRYIPQSFPNRRIGAWDRAAMFFRIDKYREPLDLWDCNHPAFLSTPSALILRIKNLIIVTVSNNYMLTDAFGLGGAVRLDPSDEDGEWIPGDGKYAAGFGSRRTRLGTGFVVAQAMRRAYFKQGQQIPAPALKANGDGHVYHLFQNRWERTKSLDFSKLPVLSRDLGVALAGLEVCEWLILFKERDHVLVGKPSNYFAAESLSSLYVEKSLLLEAVAASRGGLLAPFDDRN